MNSLWMRYLARAVAALILSVALLGPAQAQASSRQEFSRGLLLAQTGQWDALDNMRAGITDLVSRDIIDWHRLRALKGSFDECEDFTNRNFDWPGMPLLRQSCENAISWGTKSDRVLRFFENQTPRTGIGALRLAEAYLATDREDDATAEIQRAWLTMPLNPSEHRLYLARHGDRIKDLHTRRIDMLIWRNAQGAALRMFPLVTEDWRKLATARMALRDLDGNVDTLIEDLPEDMALDSGLAYERFNWRMRKDRPAAAIELLLERSLSPLDLGDPQVWARQRIYLAREMMRDGKPTLAYEIASTHFMEDGPRYADLEWLSGYLALRRLKSPSQAVFHFERFRNAVATPISLGRAGYWLGRAREAAGDKDGAARAYAQGAKYQSSFYGQLAAEKSGTVAPDGMTGKAPVPNWRKAPFIRSRVLGAAMLLYTEGQADLAERFLLHIAESQDAQGIAQLAELAFELENPHIALMLAKQGARQGLEVWKPYFPVTTPAGLGLPIADEIALSIARRESEFNPVVASTAGARGLMQIMPATAKEISARIGEDYSPNRLLTDSEYNARVGGQFLAELSKRYDSNLVLMSAAYNAGPSRVRRWVAEFGDPRSPQVDVVDWIESIPFRETRNYVMRVTESIAPYRARLSGKVVAPALTELLKR